MIRRRSCRFQSKICQILSVRFPWLTQCTHGYCQINNFQVHSVQVDPPKMTSSGLFLLTVSIVLTVAVHQGEFWLQGSIDNLWILLIVNQPRYCKREFLQVQMGNCSNILRHVSPLDWWLCHFHRFFPIDENNSTHSRRKKHEQNTAHHEHTFGNVVEFSTARQIVTENGESEIIINLCGRSLFLPSQWRAVLELYVGG